MSGTFSALGSFNTASAGEPAPFNVFCGSDPDPGPACAANWSFVFAAPGSASNVSFTIGLFDHEAAAPGDQGARFTVGGVNLTTALNAALNAGGGTQVEYDVYTLALPNSALPAILAGNVAVVLNFSGPSLGGLPGTTNTTFPFNGVGLDFATLSFDSGRGDRS